ncbi:hypothetical protein PRK78_000849 [Emydomyces testavorans]|uniref:Membrane insertase YidC/Oxa/ALB C-terminal domain-containing protein n=1 Tax=Emydomyces testavorans TaxID=2070801 RepID=A0AAF0DBV6_9EURO|nr:hypothetical protein PRK78_000849 [Emydomyces testavorans]
MINEAVLLAHNLLEGVHSATGLPWAASIPLTAVLVRLTVAMPLQVWALSHSRRMKKLDPLLIGWGRFFQGAVMADATKNRIFLTPRAAELQSQRLLRKKRKELYKRWKIHRWTRYAPWFQLPVWLAMMESIRRMVGTSGGLLSIIQSWVEKSPNTLNVPIDQSLSTEGALWFPDLLAADPHGVLPVILAATVFTNVTWGWKTKTPEEISKLPYKKEKIMAHGLGVLKRTFQASALLLWPVMTMSQVPAGMLIYWISSTLFATAQTQTLPKMLGAKPMPTPCTEKAAAFLHGSESKSESSASKDLGRTSTKIKTLTSR